MADARFVLNQGGLQHLEGLLVGTITTITDDIKGDAKSIVPVETGTLRDSIKSDVSTTGGKAVGRVYSDVDYAPDVELGTSKMRAQPYLTPALYKKRG